MREIIKKLTPDFLIRIYQKARYLGITALFYVAWLFPIDKKMVVLCNVWGFGDNPRYVTLELCRRARESRKEYRLVYVTNHPEQVPKEACLKAYRTNSVRAVFALARAAVWVESNRKEAYIRKRKGQYYIQMWHGGVALKKVEADCRETLGEEYIRRAKKDSANTDLFISNSTFCTAMYRRAFWANCEIAEYGSPRNDAFIQNMGRRKTKQGTHIAIYAPTYRKDSDTCPVFDADSICEALSSRFGGEWSLYVRLHPLVAARDDLSGLSGSYTDISQEPDLYEYLYTADVLITDYSNTMFEFAMTGKPVFLYASDEKQYEAERGLYFDFERLPFPKSKNIPELAECVRKYQEEEYGPAQKKFFEQIGLKESGRAAAWVADRIEERIS